MTMTVRGRIRGRSGWIFLLAVLVFAGLALPPVADLHASPGAGHHINPMASPGHASEGHDSNPGGADGTIADKAIALHCGALSCATSSAGLPAAGGYFLHRLVSLCVFAGQEASLRSLFPDRDPPVPKAGISQT